MLASIIALRKVYSIHLVGAVEYDGRRHGEAQHLGLFAWQSC